MINKIDEKVLIEIAQDAGKAILEIYNSDDFGVEIKEDKSPLTAADKAANDVIVKGLEKHYPEIPILSEEMKEVEYEVRKNWEYFWLVDPLDGTKEFIKRNGEFTVNIALIHNGEPILGVIDLPVKTTTYFARKGDNKCSYKVDKNGKSDIKVKPADGDTCIIMASRSHLNEETQNFVDEQKKRFENIEFVSAGSSLKFCFIAEGKANMYPRFAPTMEWDTGAGQVIAECAGATVINKETGKPLQYNKENLLNPYFLVNT
ncbi:UNVERIFIED_CONTAM: hypothetical protein GTU68_031540 [Idotea baltica]|nr:hypothetical protein [Idotea baltica]